ncbi:MAG: preprotein translocase subunit YajC [Planctomycetota bacterium]
MQHPPISLLPLPSPGGTAVGCVVQIPIAQANPGGNKVPGTLELLVSYLPFVLVVVAAWLLLYRPERERMRRQQELLGSLKKNDRVVTSSGIYGTVANVERDADRVFLRVDDSGNVKIAVTLASIAKVLDASTEPSTTAP